MRKLIMGAAVALPLAFAGTAQADTNIPSLTGDWSVTNPSVKQVKEGVQFGAYADGGKAGGTLLYTGGNGLKLSEVDNFSFTFSYNQRENTSGAVPYGRIWLDTDKNGAWDSNLDKAIMFDPSKGGTAGTLSQGIDHSFGTSDNSVRFDDDIGDDGQRKWDEVVAAHSDEDVIMVGVSAGFTGSTNVSAMLKKLTFNGETFGFATPPADGRNGTDGTNGTNGVDGKDGVTTTIPEDAVAVRVARGLRGATMRTLHVRKVAGMKFISARASLRGKSVQTIRGRTIKVDLRGKSAGRYRVFITAKYKAHGKVYKVRSTRSLNIISK